LNFLNDLPASSSGGRGEDEQHRSGARQMVLLRVVGDSLLVPLMVLAKFSSHADRSAV
jgi:hypothetical protein